MAEPTAPKMPEPGLIYMGLTGGPEHAYSAEQICAYGAAMLEYAAQIAENATRKERRISAICNGEPPKECEIAAAIRNAAKGMNDVR